MDRSLGKNTLATLAARAFTTASQVLILALIARAYGGNTLDDYAVLFALASLGGVVSDFGAGLYVTREVALGRSPSFGLCSRMLLVVPLLLLLLWAAADSRLGASEALAVSLLIISIAASLLAKGLFWGQLLFEREAAIASSEVAALCLALGGVAVGVLPHFDPLLLAAGCFGAGAIARWIWILASSRPLLAARTARARWLREVSPYGLQSLVTTSSAHLDLILLALLWAAPAPGAVAAYAVALRVYYAAPMPLEALSAALLPRLVTDPMRRIRQMTVLGSAGCLLTVSGVLIFVAAAPSLGFEAGVVESLRSVLWILLLAVPVRCASYLLGAVVTAQGAQRERLIASSAALTTMVMLDLLLIPAFGPTGAAWALVAADCVLASGYGLAAYRALRAPRDRLATGRA